MRTLITLLSALTISLSISAQTITKSPVFETSMQSLTISASDDGKTLFWLYQNPKYQAIIDIVSFNTSKEEGVELMDECVRLLEMERTGKDNDIRHKFAGVSMTRYGFSQKIIRLHEGLQVNKRMALKIKQKIIDYNY